MAFHPFCERCQGWHPLGHCTEYQLTDHDRVASKHDPRCRKCGKRFYEHDGTPHHPICPTGRNLMLEGSK
jgi:transposase-like protein